MTEEGTLSIVRQAQSCHIRYATNNPYTLVGSPAQIQGSFLVAAAGDAPAVHQA